MEKIFIGKVKKNVPEKFKKQLQIVINENVYLSKHKWTCDWYWGMGYIENKNCYCHWKDVLKGCYDQKQIFVKPVFDADDWWKMQDLMKQAYNLKNTAEIYRHGGFLCGDAEISNLIKDVEMEKRLNKDCKTVLDKLWKIAMESQNGNK